MKNTYIIEVETDGEQLVYPIKIEDILIFKTGVYTVGDLKFWVVSNLKEV